MKAVLSAIGVAFAFIAGVIFGQILEIEDGKKVAKFIEAHNCKAVNFYDNMHFVCDIGHWKRSDILKMPIVVKELKKDTP